jgi:hypothetical protein
MLKLAELYDIDSINEQAITGKVYNLIKNNKKGALRKHILEAMRDGNDAINEHITKNRLKNPQVFFDLSTLEQSKKTLKNKTLSLTFCVAEHHEGKQATKDRCLAYYEDVVDRGISFTDEQSEPCNYDEVSAEAIEDRNMGYYCTFIVQFQ